jgi:hypothetical protein
VEGLNAAQCSYKPAPDDWSILENLEHLVLAEVSGVTKIWKAAESFSSDSQAFSGEHTNRGLSIEEVVARTGKPRVGATDRRAAHRWAAELLERLFRCLPGGAGATRCGDFPPSCAARWMPGRGWSSCGSTSNVIRLR